MPEVTDPESIVEGPLIDQGLPLVLAVTAPGCHQCRALRPKLQGAAFENDGSVGYLEASAPDHPDLVDRFGIRATPTVIAIRDGNIVGRLVGAGSRRDVDGLFEAAVGGGSKRGVLGRTDRALRTFSGLAMAVVGAVTATWWLTVTGVVLLGAGWHDLLRPRRRV